MNAKEKKSCGETTSHDKLHCCAVSSFVVSNIKFMIKVEMLELHVNASMGTRKKYHMNNAS